MLLSASGAEAFEFLEPVLEGDQFGHGLGLPFLMFHHQESLAIGGDVPGADRSAAEIARQLKQKTGLAGGEAGRSLNVNDKEFALGRRP